jgi:hypothetical protein
MTVAFPEIVPTGRSIKPGTYAMQSFRAMSGAETRILYGDKIIGTELTLTYNNLPDSKAAQFMDHYIDMKGTFDSFNFSVLDTKAKAGWQENSNYLSPRAGSDDADLSWRYKEPPVITNVQLGYSNVQVTLVGVNKG